MVEERNDEATGQAMLSHDENRDSAPRRKAEQHWSLRRPTYICFAVIAAIITVVLGILNFYSNRNHGICSAGEATHYFWTYVPTAFFTLIASIWANADYRAKLVQPWECMASAPQAASQSVLLDYVSPMNIVVFAKSTYRRHYLSALVVAVTLGHQVAITLSTGLFFLDNEQITSKSSQISTVESFLTNGEDFNRNNTNVLPWTTVLSFQQYGLRPPPGTTFDEAFQYFTSPEELGPHVISTSANVEVFSSTLDCHPVTYPSSFAAPEYVPSCPAGVQLLSTDFKTNLNVNWVAWFSIGKCLNTEYSTSGGGLIIGVSRQEDPHGYNLTANTTSLFCEPTYKIEERSVTIYRDAKIEIREATLNSNPRSIEGLSGYDLAHVFYFTLDSNQIFHTPSNFSLLDVEFAWTSLNLYEPPTSITEFQDAHVMESWLQGAWLKYSAQLANTQLKISGGEVVGGDTQVKVERLMLRGVSFWTIQSVLIAVVLLLAALCLVPIRSGLCSNAASLIGTGALLAQSKQFLSLLENMGQSDSEQLEKHLSRGKSYVTQSFDGAGEHTNVRIELSLNEACRQHDQPLNGKITKWFHPFPTRYEYRIGMSFLLAALIVVLELLYRRSVAYNGVLNLSNSDSVQHLAWTYFPTVVMIGTGTLASMLHFWANVFQPYYALWEGSSNPRSSICRHTSGLSSIWATIRHMEIAVLSTTLLSLTAAFLPIATSGLYSPRSSVDNSTALLNQADWFLNHTFYQEWPGVLTPMVTAGNLSSPKHVYGNLALPRVDRTLSTNVTAFNGMLPVLRGSFNCSVISPDSLSATILSHGPNQYPFSGDVALKTTLQNQSNCSNTTIWHIPDKGYFGAMKPMTDNYAVQFYDQPTKSNNVYYELDTHSDVYGTDCPTAYGILTEIGSNHEVSNITMFSCWPFAQQGKANVTFTWPDMDIDPSQPPVVDEQSLTPFDISYWRERPLDLFYQIEARPPAPASFGILDNFMDNVIFGKHGIPVTELIGAVNSQRLIESVNDLWGIAFALQMNSFRTPDVADRSIPGTATYNGPVRLIQSRLSTRLLQALLGLMLLLLLIAFSTMKTRKVLPKNPNSIAAVGSLLAGSKLIEVVASAPQDLPDEALLKVRGLDKCVYSLGLWREGTNVNRRFGIDIGIADRAL